MKLKQEPNIYPRYIMSLKDLIYEKKAIVKRHYNKYVLACKDVRALKSELKIRMESFER